jgi:hypothetical protein
VAPKKSKKKLSINKDTLRGLTNEELDKAKGGYTNRSYNTLGYCSTESLAGHKCYVPGTNTCMSRC